MRDNIKVLMNYLFRHEWKKKCVTLSEIAEWIRSGKCQQRVEATRGYRTIASEGGMSLGPQAAKELPNVQPAKGYPMKGEQYSYTGLVLLSFRVEEGVETLEHLRQKVNLWEQTLLSFIGSSGRSLKVLVPYRLVGGGLPTEETEISLFQQYAYKRAADFAYASTGIRVEEQLHDGTERFRLSFDPHVYYHQEARPIEMPQPTEPLTDKTAQIISKPTETGIDIKVLPGYTRGEMDATKFNYICRQLAYGQELPKEEFLMRLANSCRNAGIEKELAINLTNSTDLFFQKDVLVRSTFDNAYEKHPLGMTNPIEKSLMHQQLLEEFLRNRYKFRRNRVTGDIEYQERFRYMLSWKPLTEEVRNDINNEAIREGIKVWAKDLERIIVSERTEIYDPVHDWLEALPAWDGRDRLGELADRVKTKTPCWHENFKTWMRSMVSQWRAGCNSLYGAQMVLMLLGGQGTRKSSFMRMLLPKELMPYYIDRIDFANKKEALRALSRFLLINIDEYDQVSKAQTAFLKHLIQRTDVKERKLYSTTFEQQQRYAAFCATTNSLMPLKDESGSRRYMVVEVEEPIDTDTAGDKAIDYRQLYAQIVFEIEHGEEYAFTGEREQQIIAQNADYYETPNVISLFEDIFRKPQAGDEVLLLSPTEILKKLKMDPGNRANTTVLGSYLRRNGFGKGDGNNRRRYKVALTTSDNL